MCCHQIWWYKHRYIIENPETLWWLFFSVFQYNPCKKISLCIFTENNLQSDRSQINNEIKFGSTQINSIFIKQSESLDLFKIHLDFLPAFLIGSSWWAYCNGRKIQTITNEKRKWKGYTKTFEKALKISGVPWRYWNRESDFN